MTDPGPSASRATPAGLLERARPWTGRRAAPEAPVEEPLGAHHTPRPRFQLSRRIVGASRYPLGLLTAIYAINQVHEFLVPVLFPFIKQEFGLSDTALGFLGGSYLITLTLGMVPFGILADRVRRTKVIGWGTSAWGIAMLWGGLAGSYIHVLIARSLLGIADPADNPTSQSLLADYYPVNQRAKVMGVYEAGRLLGILALPLAGAMAEAWGWRSAFFFFAVPGFVTAIMAWFLKEPTRGEQERRHQSLAETGAASVYETMGSGRAYREIFRVPTFTISLVSSGVANFFLGGVSVWAVTYMIRFHDLAVSQASAAVGLFAIGALVGSLSAGTISDHLTSRGFPSSRIYVAGGARVLAFLLFVPTFLTPNTALMLLLFTVAAAALVAPIPALHAVRADVLHPHLRGRGNSLDAVTQSAAGAASPVLFGFFSDSFGLQAAFLTMAPVVGIAGLLLLVLGPRFYRPDEQRMLEQVAAEAAADGEPPAGDGALSDGDGDGGDGDGGDGDGDGRGEGGGASDRGAGDGARAAATEGVSAGESDDAEHGGERRSGSESDAGADRDLLLEVRGAEFSYGPLQALFGVDFELGRGRCAALLGPNGAGKTTFLKLISGHLEPQRGQVHFDGQDITGVPPEQRVWLGITLMGGGRSTFPSLTVQENLWMGAFPYVRRAPRLAESRMEAVLDTFPALQGRLAQQAGTLSGGEQQMVALGRALVAGSRLLLLDELSMGLAPAVTEELLGAAREIVALGTTLLVVEQSVEVALELADDVFAMEKGEIRSLGSARELRRKPPDEIPSLLLSSSSASASSSSNGSPPGAGRDGGRRRSARTRGAGTRGGRRAKRTRSGSTRRQVRRGDTKGRSGARQGSTGRTDTRRSGTRRGGTRRGDTRGSGTGRGGTGTGGTGRTGTRGSGTRGGGTRRSGGSR